MTFTPKATGNRSTVVIIKQQRSGHSVVEHLAQRSWARSRSQLYRRIAVNVPANSAGEHDQRGADGDLVQHG